MHSSPLWHPVFWRLSLSLWVIYLFHFRHLAAGSDRFVVLMQAIVERGTISLAHYVNSPFYQDFLIDVFVYGDRPLLNINPGLSFLATPAWALVYSVYQLLPPDSLLRQEALHFWLAHFVSVASVTALLSTLTAWLLGGLVYHRSQSLRRGVSAALLYGLGSIAFFFSTRLNQNIAISFIAVAVYVLLFEPRLLGVRSPRVALTAIGFLLAWGWFIDITVAPLTAVASVALFWHHRQALLRLGFVLLGAGPPLVGQLLYNAIAFGNPLLPTTIMLARADGARAGTNSLGPSSLAWPSITNHLVGLEAGLWIYMPYALLSVYYGLRYWREQRSLRRGEKGVLALGFLLYLLFIGTIPPDYLYPLFGPRYILPVVPFTVLLFCLYVRRRELPWAGVLVAIALLVNLAGAQLGNDTNNALLTVGVYLVKGPWLPILDWLQVTLPTLTNFSPSFVSPLGLLLALAGCLALIWLPYWLPGQSPSS